MCVQLPGISGIEAASLIRNWERDHGLPPVVMFGLTGNVEEENLHAYHQVGMNGCIVKGKQLGDALGQALAQLERTPRAFINLSGHALRPDDVTTAP